MLTKLCNYWHFLLLGCFLVGAVLLFLVCGEKSYIAIHDNLDLFVAQFQMLKNTGTFFGISEVPFLGGISRDSLPSEFSLYSVLYMIFPSFWAYVIGYFVKIIVAVVAVWLLAKEWYGEHFRAYKSITVVMGFAYGALNMFPAYGIPFSSIPLVIWLLIKIYKKPKISLYIGLFCYPFLSYFSYFGLFILGYLVVAIVWISIKNKKVAVTLVGALFVLAVGYVVFEYRLFGLMLFGDVETIRASIVDANLAPAEIVNEMFGVWKNGMFHAESVHNTFVLPVCVAYFFLQNGWYLVKKNGKAVFADVYNLIMLGIVFNSVIYGFYFWEGFRMMIESLVPPLKGWQFNRTVFFSPFLWYAGFFLVLQRLYGLKNKKIVWIANLAALVALSVVLVTPVRYNDLYDTFKNNVLLYCKGKVPQELNYEEFYSVALFDKIKQDMNYKGQWAVAYGIHPAVLQYNGIATLDGYLGFYPQAYKEAFRKIIAPALDRVEGSRLYYDDWGARAYLFSGTDLSVVSGTKDIQVTDYDLYIDGEAFAQLGGKYLFSRIPIANGTAASFRLIDSYEGEDSPYQMYVYEYVGTS